MTILQELYDIQWPEVSPQTASGADHLYELTVPMRVRQTRDLVLSIWMSMTLVDDARHIIALAWAANLG